MSNHSFNIVKICNIGIPVSKTVWNEFDEFGLLLGLKRSKGENNWSYRRRLSDVFVHRANSSYRGLVNGITRELGLALFYPIEINPKRRLSDDRFYAADPYILFDGAYLYLYSDYANTTLDYKIDRHQMGGNYETLGQLVDFINDTTYFEANLTSEIYRNTKSMTIVNQSNRGIVELEGIQVSKKFRLDNERIIEGTIYFNNIEVFNIEKSASNLLSSTGHYYIDYNKGIITLYSMPSIDTAARYEYYQYPFKPVASPIIIFDINNTNIKTKLFEQILQTDNTYENGVPTELGSDIINELLSVVPMYWGI